MANCFGTQVRIPTKFLTPPPTETRCNTSMCAPQYGSAVCKGSIQGPGRCSASITNDGNQSFLTKIQNRISKKTRKKIILLSCRKIVKTQFFGRISFHFFNSIFEGGRFSLQFLNSFFQGSRIFFRFLIFCQECYYFQKLVGVVVFTKVCGPFESLDLCKNHYSH
jgi:hypothetical protein